MTNDFDLRPAATAPGDAAVEGRPARPRTLTLLDDTQRAAFLSEWDAVQTGFVADPRRAAEAAERLVAQVADSVVRSVGEIVDAAHDNAGHDNTGHDNTGHDDAAHDARPGTEPVGAPEGGGAAEVPAPDDDEEAWRERLLRCREAFHLLIDS